MVERIMYVDPETPLNCIYTARIKGEIPEENFKTALIRIQQKHPILRTNIDHNKGRYPFLWDKEILNLFPFVLWSVKQTKIGLKNLKKDGLNFLKLPKTTC